MIGRHANAGVCKPGKPKDTNQMQTEARMDAFEKRLAILEHKAKKE